MKDFVTKPIKYHSTSKIRREEENVSKDKKWYILKADMYGSAFSLNNNFELDNYKKYRGIRDKSKFQQRLGIYGNLKFPVPDIPHIPLIRRYIDHLVSVNRLRPLVFNISYNDAFAIRKKDEELVAKVTEEAINLLMKSVSKSIQNQGKEDQKQQQELQMKIQEITDKMPSFRTAQETSARKVLDYCIERLNLKEKLSDAFLDQLISGKIYDKCKVKRLGELPEYEIINPVEIAFSAEHVDNLNECEFVVHKKWLSYSDVMLRYGHLFNQEDLNNLEMYKETYTVNSNNTFIPLQYDELGYIGSSYANLIEVEEIEWKHNEKIDYNELDEKVKGKRNIKGEKEPDYRYYQTLHTCTRINNNIYVEWGEVEYARRNPKDISKVLLSFNGKLYNTKNNPPLSLVNELSDLQDRYDIVWYKLLEMLLLSGNKGTVLIEELLPAGVKADEWLYWKKLGVARFSVSQEGIDKLVGQLGQTLASYDDTLSSNGVQTCLGLIQQIEKTVGDICGIPPQMLGQTQQYETKANTQLSVTQGTITTEKIHQFHEDFVREALNNILHCAKICFSEGEIKNYILTEEEQKLNKNLDWSWIDYNVFVSNSYKLEKNLNTAKELVAELVKNQMIPFDALIKTLNSDSISQIEEIITKAVKRMEESQKDNSEMEFKQKELQLKIEELKHKVEQENNKLVRDEKIKQEELAIKDRLAIVEEKYVNIAEKQLNEEIDLSNKKADSRQGRNEKIKI